MIRFPNDVDIILIVMRTIVRVWYQPIRENKDKMTTAQYLFQTIINPDVVYKAYLKWLGMLLPGCEPVVQMKSERFL